MPSETTGTVLEVGDRFLMGFGPYEALVEVVDITEAGAVLKYARHAYLADKEDQPPITNQAGDVLAPAGRGFLGRAHWPEVHLIVRGP